jgi:hypothetical protein
MLSDAKIRRLKPKEKAYKVYDDRGLYMGTGRGGGGLSTSPTGGSAGFRSACTRM